MMAINQSALANAVINITGNTQGLDRAIGQTKKQMHGFMVFAQAMGGRTGGFLANMFAAGGAHPLLQAVLGANAGGKASQALQGAGLLQNPVGDIDAAMERARRQHARDVMTHRMAGAGLQIGAMFQGQRINTPLDLRVARVRHGMAAPKLEDAMRNAGVNTAAQEAQQLAMEFGKLGGVVVVASAAFSKLVKVGLELDQNMRRMTRTFGRSTADAMAGHGGFGSTMSNSEYAAGATHIGAGLLQSGIGGARGARMSAALARRSGELAASFGEDFGSVSRAMEAAVGGSDSALKKFGVVMSEDLVRAQAFNSGMIKLRETMSESTAAVARFDLIMSQTRGAAQSGAEAFFNLDTQWSIFTSNLTSGMGLLGAAITPVAAGVLGLANNFVWLASKLEVLKYALPGNLATSLLGVGGGGEAAGPDRAELLTRARDDASRADAFLKRERARQSSNVGFHGIDEFAKSIQKGIFGDREELLRRQVDLQHDFLVVSREQLQELKDFGAKVKDGSALLQP